MAVPRPLSSQKEKPLAIDVLLTEQQIAGDFAAALSRRFLDERFFYWLPLSVSAWVELCGTGSYRNAQRSVEVLATSASMLARHWPGCDTFCGLGCGDGGKDRLLLEAFAELGRHLFYVGADFSQSLLEMALGAAIPVTSGVRGLKLDILSDQHLTTVMLTAAAAGQSCAYTVLGNTLGAFGPTVFPARLRRLMRPLDRVVFDGEIFAGEETLRGYDNPTNRRFAFAPLAGVGVSDRDGELRFELRPGLNGMHEVAKYFVPARDLSLKIGAHVVELSAGEKLLMSSSVKYDKPTLLDSVTRGGFRIEFSRASSDGRFLLIAAAPE